MNGLDLLGDAASKVAGADILIARLGLNAEANIMAADFATATMRVKAAADPAKRYGGPMAGKMVYSGSAKYRRDAAGVLVPATGILPEYDIAGINIGYRSEPQDVNRLLRSGDLSNAAWVASNMSVAPVAAADPAGGMTAWMLTDDQSAATSKKTQSFAVTVNSLTHQVRVWIKKASAPTTAIAGLSIVLSGGGTVTASPRIDPYSGAVAGGGVATDAGGWWILRCPIANNSTNNLLTVAVIPAARSAIGAADADAAQGSNTFWNPQAGDNFVASSPIVTTTATATRSADSLYMLLGALPWDTDEGTLVVRSRTDGAWGTYSPSIGINGPGTAQTDSFAIAHNYEGTTAFGGTKNGVEQFRLRDGAVSNAFVTSAGAWAPNNVAFARNGGAVTLTDAVADTNLTVANRLYFGSRSSVYMLQGHVLWAVWLPRRVSNSELQALSALT